MRLLASIFILTTTMAGPAFSDSTVESPYPDYVDIESTITSITIEAGGAVLVSLKDGYAPAVQAYEGLPCGSPDAVAIIADSKVTQKAGLIAANISGQTIILRITGCDKKRKENFSVSDISLQN